MSFTNLITNLIPPCIIAILVVTIIISRDKSGYYTINSSDMRSLVKITSIVFLALIILTTCLSNKYSKNDTTSTFGLDDDDDDDDDDEDYDDFDYEF